ncbi:hypothetical protein EVAR_86370_1 [Eumeta japonica]|uniref:Uncharacterized protein n=1 Tax=Eumeta variegata TaxID=151549 RepID=A0A4C1YFN1_EUMVA|nr:hypothetical protein EVAR_86370_1 [Eumeta japonica]
MRNVNNKLYPGEAEPRYCSFSKKENQNGNLFMSKSAKAAAGAGFCYLRHKAVLVTTNYHPILASPARRGEGRAGLASPGTLKRPLRPCPDVNLTITVPNYRGRPLKEPWKRLRILYPDYVRAAVLALMYVYWKRVKNTRDQASSNGRIP